MRFYIEKELDDRRQYDSLIRFLGDKITMFTALEALESVLSEAEISPVDNIKAEDVSTMEGYTYKGRKTYAYSGGTAGEAAVDYILEWLPESYCVIEKNCSGRHCDNVLVLVNNYFGNKTQEFDHLVIGPQGIFNIETKNYSGELYIDKKGNWNHFCKGESIWTTEVNPVEHLLRNHIFLQGLVGPDVPIHDLVCLSHPSIKVFGQENSSIPVIKKDFLAEYLVNNHSRLLTPEQVKDVENKINSAKRGSK